MKTFYALFLALFFSLTALSQAIPNGSLEDWETSGYKNPLHWDTSNLSIAFINVTTVKKETNGYSGNCARLESVKPSMMTSSIAPGLITLGTFVVDVLAETGDIIGGIPWTTRPAFFNTYYKYIPKSGDSCFIAIGFFKYNALTQTTDTIGTAAFSTSATVTEWTELNLEIEWLTNEYPDSMNIIIMSSDGLGTPRQGTVLYVDELSFSGTVGVNSIANFDNLVSIYPNPACDFITLLYSNNANISIIDMLGREVMFINNYNGNKIDISFLEEGNYIVRINGNQINDNYKLSIVR